MEGQQTGCTGECAFGKEDAGFSAPGEVGQMLCILDAGTGVESFDEHDVHAPQEQSDERDASQLTFRDEATWVGQGGDDEQTVEVTRVIGDDDAATCRAQMLSIDYPERDADEKDQQLRGAASNKPGALRTQRQEQQQENGGAEQSKGRPEVAGVGKSRDPAQKALRGRSKGD